MIEYDFVQSMEMFDFFHNRGYLDKIIKQAHERCCAIPHSEALLITNKDHPVKIHLVLPYHQSSVKFVNTIHRNVKILADDGELGPSTLAVPEQLSNGGGKNVGHSPAESGTDF